MENNERAKQQFFKRILLANAKLDEPVSKDLISLALSKGNPVEYQECNEYIVCYEEPNGEVTEVVNMGVQEQPLIIADQRIFYVVGSDLVSIDFEGNDRTTLLDTDTDNGVYFEKIDRIEEDWLYCIGRKKTEIYGDPVALDGVHFVLTLFKVKPDFSEYLEISG